MACSLGMLICNNLSCTLFGAHFCAYFFAKTFLTHCLLHVLGAFLCKNLSCTLFGAHFLVFFLSNNLCYSLLMAQYFCSFAATSCTLFGAHFWGYVFATTFLTHCLVHVFRAYFFARNSQVHFGAHLLFVFLYNKLSCTLFAGRSWVSFFAKTSLAHLLALFTGVFLYNKHCLLHVFGRLLYTLIGEHFST